MLRIKPLEGSAVHVLLHRLNYIICCIDSVCVFLAMLIVAGVFTELVDVMAVLDVYELVQVAVPMAALVGFLGFNI